MSSFLVRLVLAAILSVIALAPVGFAQTAGAAPKAVSMDKLRNDAVIGKPDAPHVLDAYVSYTCPHCSDYWNNELPKIDAELVKTGKLRINVRPAIFNNLDLIVSVATGCLAEPERAGFIATIYKEQADMMTAAQGGQNLAPFILDRMAARGMAEGAARTCLKDDSRGEAIMAGFEEATAALLPQINELFGEECKARSGQPCQGMMTPMHALDGKLIEDGSLSGLKTLVAQPAKKAATKAKPKN